MNTTVISIPLMPGSDQSAGLGNGWKTRWSLILARQSMAPDEADKAAAELLKQYRGLLIRYAANRVPPHDLEDVIHDFLIRVVSSRLLARANPDKGSFRSLVRKALDNFLDEEYRKQHSLKRNPAERAEAFQIHTESAQAGVESPDDFYDLCWFTELVERSRQELWAADSVEWAVSEHLLLHIPRDEVATKFGLTTARLSELIRKVRRELREMVQSQLRQLCGTREVYDQEWEALSRYARKSSTA